MALILTTIVSLVSLRRKLACLLLSIVANLARAIAVVGVVRMVCILAAWVLWLLIFVILAYQIVIAWRVASSSYLLLISQLLFFAGMNRLVIASRRTLEGSNSSSGDLVCVCCSSRAHLI